MREAWLKQQSGSAAAIAAPVSFGLAKSKRPFSLVVDLGEDIFSRQWWRGAATLLALCAAAAAFAPRLEPLSGGRPARPGSAIREQWAATGVESLSEGSRSGIRMAATSRVEPIDQAPERISIALFATVGADGLARSLARVGASYADAIEAERLVRGGGRKAAPGSSVSVRLGQKGAGGRRPIEQVALHAGIDMKLVLSRGEGGLTLTKFPIRVDTTPLRIRGRAGSGLYWALRSAGASSEAAAQYLRALATQLDVGEIGPDDRFDLILAHRRTAGGESQTGPLLYAGLDRAAAGDLQLIRWSLGGRATWIDAGNAEQAQASNAMAWPVAAPITSGFGLRVHPILRFARMHRGIDFGAGHGTPIHAAADGQVSRASFAGGYGRQVRIAHGGGLTTSYSHMSRMIVDEGMPVRQGQVIGYVGSSGLSTGPHLHYEVHRHGQAVNPMSVRFTSAAAADPATVNAIKARLKALLSVGSKG
jgi:murein DD-endopeptidase MepM/ murein hydrolase activator NlpD